MTTLHPGDRLADRFEIEGLAGVGGMGTVYRARDRIGGGAVAVKLLQRWSAVDEERFAREASLLAELSHPGIVRYVGHGITPSGAHYLAMEWAPGDTLEQRLADGHLHFGEVRTLGLQVAGALAAAHRLGIVHRDIKPSNLVLIEDDAGRIERVKVLDFGIARRAARGESSPASRVSSSVRHHTATGVVLGTPGYMAPEQARGRRDLDVRVDVFALGCVLFEAATGRAAFCGADVMAVLAKILLEETPRASSVRGDLPAALDDLLLRMMAKEPEGRPPDAAAVAEELERLGEALSAGPVGASFTATTGERGEDAYAHYSAAPAGTPPSLEVAAAERAIEGRKGTLAGGPLHPTRGRRGSLGRVDAISREEQRILCLVLVGGSRPGGGAVGVADTVEARGSGRAALLERLSAPYGARLEALADGSTVVTLTGSGSAADEAARAARYALALRAAVDEAPMALVVRRGVMGGRLPIGEVIDHAVATLRAARPGEIRINDACLHLLETRFEIARTSRSSWSGSLSPARDRCEPATDGPRVVALLGGGEVGDPGAGGHSDGDRHRPARASAIAGAGAGANADGDGDRDGATVSRADRRGDDGGACLVRERAVLDGPRTVLGRATTCVGRDRELAVLDGILAECTSEPVARAVLITAPAGAGKTRLLHEFLSRAARIPGGVELLIAEGDPLSAGAAFGLLAPALRRAAGITDGEPLELRRRKLATRVGRHLAPAAARRAVELLGELLSVPTPDADASDALRAARQDARLMNDGMRAAWQDFVDAECAARPVVLVLEDLHWGDLPTVQFVSAALRSARDRPLLVLALARPEVTSHFPQLWSQHDVQELRLGPLTRKASEKLVRQVLGDARGGEVASRLVERADGNPFFLEELLRGGADGAASDQLPETVLGVVQARLDVLGGEAKRVLRAASVFGQTFWHGGVRALLGDGARGVADDGGWLAELIDREVIFARGAGSFPGEGEYTFRHGLLRDAAYAMLTDADRALGHRLAGEWLHRAGEASALVIAEHLDRGGDGAGAVGFYRRAGAQALDANDFDTVIACVDRAVRCGATSDALGALHHLRAQAHAWRGQYLDAEQQATLATAHAATGSTLWFQAAAERIAALGQQGKYDEVDAWVARVQATEANGALVEGARLASLTRAAGYLMDGGRAAAATALLAQATGPAGGLAELAPRQVAGIHHAQAKRAAHAGDLGAAVDGFLAALGALESAGDARAACENRVNLGYLYAELGDFPRAEESLLLALSAAERMGLGYVAAGALHNLGPVLAQRGDLAQARAVEARAAELFRGLGDRRLEGMSHLYLSSIALLEGDLESAEGQALRAAATLWAIPPALASARAALARISLQRGDAAEAMVFAREAVELLDELGGIEDYESLLRLVYAEALAASGEAAAAREALATAVERLLRRAAKIADGRWRRSFLEELPDNARTMTLARTWGVLPAAAAATEVPVAGSAAGSSVGPAVAALAVVGGGTGDAGADGARLREQRAAGREESSSSPGPALSSRRGTRQVGASAAAARGSTAPPAREGSASVATGGGGPSSPGGMPAAVAAVLGAGPVGLCRIDDDAAVAAAVAAALDEALRTL